MTHDELRQKAIEFLAKAFELAEAPPSHMVQAATTVALSQDPKTLDEQDDDMGFPVPGSYS